MEQTEEGRLVGASGAGTGPDGALGVVLVGHDDILRSLGHGRLEALTATATARQSFRSTVVVAGPPPFPATAGALVVTSLSPHLAGGATVESVEGELRRAASQVAVEGGALMVYNVSTYVPDEVVRGFRNDTPVTVAERAQSLNLMLDTIASELDIAVVDVDRVVAELGAAEEVSGPGTYGDTTCAALAEEAIKVMHGVPRLAAVFAADLMRITVPRYDRRTVRGEILRWHAAVPGAVARGDLLFDVEFADLHFNLAQTQGDKSHRTMTVSVLAAGDGHLRQVLSPVGAIVDVGSPVAIVTREATTPTEGPAAMASDFPVGVRVQTR